MAKTLYIIDGHSQIYRAYYAPFGDLTSPTGEPTRATYVFSRMLLRFIADRKPDYLAMAVDGPAEKLHRRKIYADYKITRKPTPEDLPVQIERIMQVVEAMGIPILRAEGYEADDIMATAAEKFAGEEMNVVLISRDKDLDQLVTDNVILYEPMKGETFDPAAIEAKKGYSPDKAVEIQTLCGDSIDNIPGIPGVGPKTAVKLIAQYGSVDAVVAHADELTPKLKENILAGAETLKLSRELVTLDRSVPIDLDISAMAFKSIGKGVRPIFAELGFNKLFDVLDELGVAGGDEPLLTSGAAEAHETTAQDFDYRCIDTPEALDSLAAELAGVKRLAFDTETTSVEAMTAQLVGISLSWKPGEAVYIPVRGPLGATTLDVELVKKKLTGVFADESVEKIAQNIKYDMLVLARAEISVAGKLFDTMVAAHVLDSARMTYKLDALAAEMLNHRCIPIEDMIGRGKKQTTIDTVPIESVTVYAAEDADVAWRLADVLAKRLADEGLTELFTDLEMPLTAVLVEMEMQGIAVDPTVLKRMEIVLSKKADELKERVIVAAGHPFNPDSPKQLAEVLFGEDELALPVIKKTKTGASTDSSVLEELAAEHELPGLILDYRKLTKLLSTYLKALAQCINPQTGRVHTSFHQAGTVTGRLSSSKPNLQNIPIRSEEGRKIRSAFVADQGCVLLSADYSQVELRMLAHFCRDETLMNAFVEDRDIHRIVAAEVFHVPIDEVTPEQRSRAKTVNFGIIYGQTAFGLSRTLRIPRGEAAEFIKAYRERFPRIDGFLAECIAKAKSDGYVETIFGRRRKIAEIDARNPQRRALAERLAINSVVQGSAADLIKQAMVNISRRIHKENRPSKMLLQIHDELVFELPQDAVETEKDMIVSEMAGAIELSVPLKVDCGVGPNWMDAK